MARITPQEAGRLGGLKGGKSRSAAKLAACRKNGFQRPAPADQQPPVPEQPAAQTYPRPAVLISQPRMEAE